MSNAKLAVFVQVGQILADELNERGWTQAEFAEILGRPAQFVSEIISGKKEITRESATQIAAAFGDGSAQMWLNMQDRYYLWMQEQDERTQEQLHDVRLRARLKQLAPVSSVLRKRGLIQGATPKEQEEELKRFYNVENIFDDPEILVAARRSKTDEHVSGTQLAWISCVRHQAEKISVSTYDRSGLETLARSLTRIIDHPSRIAGLPAMFAKVGVRLVYVEAFPGSKMDGCTFLFDDGSPVIGISGRGKRFDKILFTLLHEVAHIILGHLGEGAYVIDDPGESATLGDEKPADDLASDWALPVPLPPIPERVNQPWVNAVAGNMGIHPIVLIGRLQKENRIPWKTTLVRNAPTITAQLEEW